MKAGQILSRQILSRLRNRIIGNGPETLPIGVDFQLDRLNLVQCERDGEGLIIRAAASLQYPIPRKTLLEDAVSLERFVRNAMQHSPFAGRKISAVLPASAVKAVPLTIQITEKQAEPAAVLRALRDKLRMDLSQEVVDYIKVRSTNPSVEEQNVLAIVAKRDDVMQHLRILDAAGLEAQTLEIGPAALTRVMVTLQGKNFSESEVLLNFGLTKTYITVVWGRRLMLDREMDFGREPLAQKIAKSLAVDVQSASHLLTRYGFVATPGVADLNAQEATRVLSEILHAEFAMLTEELSRTLVYIASKTHGRTAQKIYLNGSLADVPGIAEKMEENVGIPVEILSPLKQIRSRVLFDDILYDANMALATGLALRDDATIWDGTDD